MLKRVHNEANKIAKSLVANCLFSTIFSSSYKNRLFYFRFFSVSTFCFQKISPPVISHRREQNSNKKVPSTKFSSLFFCTKKKHFYSEFESRLLFNQPVEAQHFCMELFLPPNAAVQQKISELTICELSSLEMDAMVTLSREPWKFSQN